jgi:nucleoside 2-deoxyribosyltransferase
MKIIICGSIQFTSKIKEVADFLTAQGHEVEIPLTSQRIISGELTLEEFQKENKTSEAVSRKIKDDVIRRYFKLIDESDAVLILNLEKNGKPNYIGGNTFLEMGFAHVLHKPIYLYNDIPVVSYADEIVAMQPILIRGDLLKIK